MRIPNAILFTRPQQWYFQFIRYLFVGGLAAIIDVGTLYCLTEYLHIYYLVSAAIGFSLGILFNYSLSILWIFPNRKYTLSTEILLFTLIGLIGLILNEFILFVLVEFLSLWYMLAKIIAVIFTLIWNFAARKSLLFSK